MRAAKPKSDPHVLRCAHADERVTYLQRATTTTASVTFGDISTAHVFKTKHDARMFATLFYTYARDWFGLIRHINGIINIEPEPYKDTK